MQALEFVNIISDALGWGAVTTIAGTPTDEVRKILRQCNTVIRSQSNAGHCPELRTEDILDTSAVTTAAQAGVTYGSSTLTSSDSGFLATHVGWAVRVGDDLTYYRIATYVGAGEVTLDRAYLGSTDADTTYVSAPDTYELPTDFSELLGGTMLNMSTGNQLEEIDPLAMRKKKADRGLILAGDEPRYFTIHGTNSGNTARRIHLDKFCDAIYPLSYEYEAKHDELTTDTTEILFPDHMLLALTDMIIARCERDHEKSQTAAQSLADARNEISISKQSHVNGKDRVQFRPSLRTRGRYRSR